MKHARHVLPLFFAMVMCGAYAAEPEQSWTGTLLEKPANAKEGVVAALKTTLNGKEVQVNLWATGETATQLKDWAAKSARVTVTGTKVDDENVKVTKVEQAKAEPGRGEK